MKSQLSKQVTRVRELTIKKAEQPGAELPFNITKTKTGADADTRYIVQTSFMATTM